MTQALAPKTCLFPKWKRRPVKARNDGAVSGGGGKVQREFAQRREDVCGATLRNGGREVQKALPRGEVHIDPYRISISVSSTSPLAAAITSTDQAWLMRVSSVPGLAPASG